MIALPVAGHTMAAPHLDVADAIRFFAAQGLDGIEIVWQDDYRCGIPEQTEPSQLREIRRIADGEGLSVVGLGPYMRGTNSLDASVRDDAKARFRTCIDAAGILGATNVRFYGGGLEGGGPRVAAERWKHLVASLHEVAEYASAAGVSVLVENHMGTMTESAADSVTLVQQADSPGAGILYDQLNLLRSGYESAVEAIALQAPYIRHVHVKDFEPASGNPGDVWTAPPRALGDGTMDWTTVFRELAAIGYSGAITLEYEARWYPEHLPLPDVGVPRSAAYARELMRTV